jgi:hypothetical protein
VVAEGRDNAIYHITCNNSKDEAMAKDRGLRKTTCHLCDNSPTSEEAAAHERRDHIPRDRLSKPQCSLRGRILKTSRIGCIPLARVAGAS